MIKEVKYLRQTTMNVYFEVYGENLTENEIENVREIRSNSTFGNEIRITNGKTVAQVTCYKDQKIKDKFLSFIFFYLIINH